MAYIAYTKGKEPKAPRVPITEAIRLGQLTAEEMAERGWVGSPGFMGRGVFATTGREGGYRK